MSIPALFNVVTNEVNQFAAATGVQCPSGCGACCTNPNMQTTVAEMMPLATHLWESGQAETFLKRLDDLNNVDICAMYQPDKGDHNKGRCQAYQFRPGICRLFGYCARVDKHGNKQLVTCKVIKDAFPVDKIEERINKGLTVPMIGDYVMQVYGVDPLLGKTSMPINQALHKALERVGLKRLKDSPSDV